MRLGVIHHVSINVGDLPRAIEFYCEILGLEQIPRPDLRFPGAWLQAGPQQIHLLAVADHQPPEGQHFAFLSTDIDADVAALRARGITVSEPREVPGICRQCFLKDPSGNLLELNQPMA